MSGKPHIRNDLAGQRFGRLVVLRVGRHTRRQRPGKPSVYRRYWHCQCDCGNTIEVDAGSLRSGNTKTCGCVGKDRLGILRRKHGLSVIHKHEYSTWYSMINRCHNIKNANYNNYGGRGIVVCESWRDNFPAFLRDMGLRPDGTTLDRIDNNKGYTIENCHWVTLKENCRNMRKTLFITFQGRTQSLQHWAEELHINSRTLYVRIYQRHWHIDRALTTLPRARA